MFSFFKKQPKVTTDFSVLRTDMHSHLIPGIDDGAPDIETSVKLIKELQGMGFRKLITTPHIMADLYPNTPETINKGLDEVRTALAEEGIDIEIDVAAEYLMDETFGLKIEEGNLLTLPGNRVLVEMSFVSPAPSLDNYLFQLQLKGYQPIMAHPERYLYFKGNLKKYEQLIDQGCELQLNLLSLIGYYGKPIKDTAWKLLKNKMIRYLGTDLHHRKHSHQLQQLLILPQINRLLNEYEFANETLDRR